MRVTIIATGSRGDVQPYVALGLGLQGAGYQVRLATHGEFEAFVAGYGLDFSPLAGDPTEVLQSEEGQALLRSGNNPFDIARRLAPIFEQTAGEMLDDCLYASRDAEALLFSIFSLAGYDLAEKIGIPSAGAFLQPVTRTYAFPISPAPAILQGPVINRVSYIMAERLLWRPFRPLSARWRRELGLRPLPASGLYTRLYRRHYPILYGYSPAVVPRPADWGKWINVTGYWLLDAPPGWEPPAGLLDFLGSGPPPVYVGFGSMAGGDEDERVKLVAKALSLAKQRGIVARGSSTLEQSDLPGDVFLVDSVPHEWLFPRMAALVHHAGAGTTGTGLWAGVPNVGVPFFGDQYFWADRIYRLGAGPRPLPHARLTAERLAQAIRAATSSDSMRERAEAMGKRIQSEDGVARAVEAFKGIAGAVIAAAPPATES